MTWVDLSSVFTYGSKLTSTQMQNLRDNITAMANGDSGAPAIQSAALDTDSVTAAAIAAGAVDSSEIAAGAVQQGELETTTGTASKSTSGNESAPGGQYGFWIETRSGVGSTYSYYVAYQTSIGVYTAQIGFEYTSGGGVTGSVRQRYVTSSGLRHWLFVLLDETGSLVGRWEAPDHCCFGQSGKPLVHPHPFCDVFEENGHYYEFERNPETGLLTDNKLRRDILIINPTVEEVTTIIENQIVPDESRPDKCWFESVDELFEIDELHTPAWDDEPVTVGLPSHDDEGNLIIDYRYYAAMKEKVSPIKKPIPKPTYMEMAQLALKKEIIIER